MISASHTRRFCIVLGAAIILALAASATSSDERRFCNPDRDTHDGAIAPSGANIVDRAKNSVDHLENGVGCVENHAASRTFFGAETLNAR